MLVLYLYNTVLQLLICNITGKSPQKMNCNDILVFDGIYQFSYEMEYRDDGVCNSSKSQIEACQVDGSPYVDNEVFHITYDSCPGVSTPRHKSEYLQQIVDSISVFFFQVNMFTDGILQIIVNLLIMSRISAYPRQNEFSVCMLHLET